MKKKLSLKKSTMQTKQFQDLNTGELISLLPLTALPINAVVDSIIYFNGEPSDPYPFYKRYIENNIDVRWFGAKGDAVTDDSFAFQHAVNFCESSEYKIINIPDGNIFNLNNSTINIIALTLFFSGGIIKNGVLNGNHAMIESSPKKIIENIHFSGSWNTSDGFACPEWGGTIPFDSSSVDLKDSLEMLNVFKSIRFRNGLYYTFKGEIPVSNFEGCSSNRSIIIVDLNGNSLRTRYGLCIGKYQGTENERDYYNSLKDIEIITYSDDKRTNYSGVVVGACTGAVIERVNIKQNEGGMLLDEKSLKNILEDVPGNFMQANIGLEFNGCSELTSVRKLHVYSDIGMAFNTEVHLEQMQGVDFPSVYDFFSACGTFGLASVFFKYPNVAGLKMSGFQSWCEGMFGLYACSNKNDTTDYNSFWNCMIENARIEQLNAGTDFSTDGFVESTSIYINDQDNVESLVFNNIGYSGNSNGLFLGKMKSGYFEINNVTLVTDPDVPIKYFLNVNYEEVNGQAYSPFVIRMRNVVSRRDLPVIMHNAEIVEHIYYDNSPISPYKINFRDVSIIRKINVIHRKEINNSIKFNQQLTSPPSSLWLKLYHSNEATEWHSNENYTTYKIDIHSSALSFYSTITFTLFRNGNYEVQPYDSAKIFFTNTTNTQNGKINVIFEQSTGFWFLINSLPTTADYDIEGIIG